MHQGQTAPTLTASSAREICWACADRVLHKGPWVTRHRHHLDPLHCSSNSTATNKPRRNTSDTPQTDYQSPSLDPSSSRRHHRRQTYCGALGHPSQQPHGQPAIHWSPSCSRLRGDAPKEEKDAAAPPSPNHKDLRFPSRIRSRRKEEHSPTATPSRKYVTPTSVTVASSGSHN
jgi:hypothetical protein